MLGSVEFGDTTVIADLEAGIGTLTRLDAEQLDVVLVVVEPTPKSIEVGNRAAGLAREKALGRVLVVANRVRGDDDLAMIQGALPVDEVVPVPDDPAVVAADRHGDSPLDTAPASPAVSALVRLAERLLPVPAEG
ncbi:MAG: hypothetical protein ACRD0U_09235 [Acidimicrobiales bacterium]